MKIYRVEHISEPFTEALTNLLPQLAPSEQAPSSEYIKELLRNPNTHLFAAEYEGAIVGMLTLVIVDIPTGRKAWIEDVVVDKQRRGIHIGEALVERAKAEAESLGAKKIYLTSNPSRQAAHALYAKYGFEIYNTSLFRLKLQ